MQQLLVNLDVGSTTVKAIMAYVEMNDFIKTP